MRKITKILVATAMTVLTLGASTALAGVLPTHDQGSAYQYYRDDMLKCTTEYPTETLGVTEEVCLQDGAYVTDFLLTHQDLYPMANSPNNPTRVHPFLRDFITQYYDLSKENGHYKIPQMRNVGDSTESFEGIEVADVHDGQIWSEVVKNHKNFVDDNYNNTVGNYGAYDVSSEDGSSFDQLEERPVVNGGRFAEVTSRRVHWQGVPQKSEFVGFEQRRIGRPAVAMIPQSSEDKIARNSPLA